MLRGKRKNKFSIICCGLALFTLASCSDEIKLPDDYEDVLFTDLPDLGDNTVVQDCLEDYYYNLIDDDYDTVYENTLDQILLAISRIAHDNTGGTDGSDVVNLINDDFDGSVADTDVADLPSVDDADNQLYRSMDQLVDISKNGTYEEDNLFMERLYVDSLKRAFTLPVDPLEGLDDPSGVLVTPDMEFADIFEGDFDAYQAYMEKYLYDDIRINYLVSEYIYTVSYASIGNSNARNVQIIGLTDRDDQPGAAKKLLDAYVNDYVLGDAGVDDDFTILSNLWKGITTDVIESFSSDEAQKEQYIDRYGSVVLDDAEEEWLSDNNIVVTSGTYTNSGTLSGEIMDDLDDLNDMAEDFNKLDTDLESTYTGSYTYDYLTGVRMAIDDIATSDFVTDGIYLQSDGISNLPDDLSDRIFSTNMTVNAEEIADMKANPGTVRYDITTYGNDGYRYLTVPDTVSSSTTTNETISPDDIIFYDSDSSTYYLVRILDVVNTQSMSTTSTTSIYSDATKREQIGREVAYVMSTTGSYKTEAVVYWLRRTEMEYSDEDFLDYMEENYPELFRTDSPYDDEDRYPKITIPQD